MGNVYNKLVRDNIPNIIRSNGEVPVTRILNEEEYKKELEKKLYEEYNEVLEASGKNRIEELADMIEVIRYLALLEGSDLDSVISTADEKSVKRGAFNDRIFLEKVLDEKR